MSTRRTFIKQSILTGGAVLASSLAGYAAFTYAWSDKEMIINYIKNQQEYHKKETFFEEY